MIAENDTRKPNVRAPRMALALLAAWALSLAAVTDALSADNGAREVDCTGVRDAVLAGAIAAAQAFLAGIWLKVGDNYYLAFQTKAEMPNPFDLAARNAPRTAEGYIWVGGLTCRAAGNAADGHVVVHLGAKGLSFNESGGGWTKPFAVRRLTDIKLTKGENAWTAVEQRDDGTALMPEDAIRKPATDEVPPASRALGIPCSPDRIWTGRKCRPADARSAGGAARKSH